MCKMRCIKEIYGFRVNIIYFFNVYKKELSYKGMIIIPDNIVNEYFEMVD